jgi:hypothetical protein
MTRKYYNDSATGSVFIFRRGKGDTFSIGSIERLEQCRLAISNASNRIGVSPPSPEDGNRSSFRNLVFSSYL